MKHFSSTFTWDWQNLPYVATRVTRGQRISEKSGQSARGCVPIAQACALPVDCAISSHVQSAATGGRPLRRRLCQPRANDQMRRVAQIQLEQRVARGGCAGLVAGFLRGEHTLPFAPFVGA